VVVGVGVGDYSKDERIDKMSLKLFESVLIIYLSQYS